MIKVLPPHPTSAPQNNKSRLAKLKKSMPLLVGFIGLALAGSKPAQAELITGLTTTNQLLSFDSAAPNTILGSVSITGLQAGETIGGIDYRPATGGLYGLGSSNQLYVINSTTGVAQLAPTLSTTPSGTSFGFDFNPVPDRLRLVSDTDQNLRINVDTGATTIDGNLAFVAGDPNAGANPNIVGSAYTNSFAGATTTTLYGIDSNLDTLVIQNPPNNGTLNTVVGSGLGLDVTNEVGFDISGTSGTAYASFTPTGGISSLYTINLNTGAANQIGVVGNGVVLRGISVAPVPEPSTYAMMGVGLLALFVFQRRKRQGEATGSDASSLSI
jgi:hypothetical protein